MNKRGIRNRFFAELEFGLPPIKEIPLSNLLPKVTNGRRNIALISALAVAASAIVVVATALFIANSPTGSSLLMVVPEKNGMALRPETADWETRIEIEKGPSESTAAKVTFGHGDIMADLLSDWNKDSPISRFNKEQPTHLGLQRVVSYYSGPYDSAEDVTTVFEHTDSLYNHICGEAFSIRSSFSVVDELSLGDFPKGWEGREEDLSLSYRVCIKSTDGEPLDYDFGDPDTSLPYINSFYCATVSYSVSKDGVGFYIKEDKKE